MYFRVKSDGSTVLHLQNTMLLDDSYPVPHEIPHTTVDGEFGVISARNIAVVQITPSKTVVNDTAVWINVTVANYGLQSETFNVTLYQFHPSILNVEDKYKIIVRFSFKVNNIVSGRFRE